MFKGYYKYNLDSKIYSDLSLVKEIRKLNLKENDYISIRCMREKWSNIKVKFDLSNEYKEELIHSIAHENRDKLIFLLLMNIITLNFKASSK